MTKKLWSSGVIAIVVMILVSACSTSNATPTPAGSATPAPSATTAHVPAVPTVPTGYTELDQALGADQPFKGKAVTIQTQWILGEGDNFDSAVADFEKATGIDVKANRISSQHEVLLKAAIEAGTPPDLATLAQPSAVVQYGSRGQALDVAKFMDPTKLNADFAAGFGTKLVSGPNGEIYGIPYKVDVKSTVWYPIKAFAAAGYKVPTTWEELQTLAAKIVADGAGSPWCVAILDGPATGWIATDWVEDVMLRTAGIDKYNEWIPGTLKFDSPEVRHALDVIGEQWFKDKYVYNGYKSITATDRLEAMDGMFPADGSNNWDAKTPKCWMHRQATWFGPDFFPDKRAGAAVSQYKLGEDIGLFYFPPIDAAQGKPGLGAGDTLMVLTDRPEVRATAQFLATPYGLKNWIDIGSAQSANVNTPKEWYKSYKQQVAADIVSNSTSFGFDASDLMPPAVNSAFWAGMVKWIEAGGANTDEVVKGIDATWPAP